MDTTYIHALGNGKIRSTYKIKIELCSVKMGLNAFVKSVDTSLHSPQKLTWAKTFYYVCIFCMSRTFLHHGSVACLTMNFVYP